jgi:hypothetical protein
LTTSAQHELFARVDALVEGSHSLQDLCLHRVELLAARRWRELGREVPMELVARERKAAATAMAAPALLERIRAETDGPLLLMKGPELARRYPDPALRGFRDLDIVVPDARATQRQLVAAGFEEAGDPSLFENIHHLRPLFWPGLPLLVEIHHGLKWIESFDQPAAAQLFGAAVPSRAGPRGVLAPSPAHHALMLAAHAWAHRPLSRLRDLIDIAVAAAEADPEQIRTLAKSWGIQRVWATTARAIHAVLGDGRSPASLVIWARHLRAAREQTVLESHIQDWLCALWVLPSGRAITAAASAIGADLVPKKDEGWSSKLARTRASLADASVRKSQHDEALDAARGGP